MSGLLSRNGGQTRDLPVLIDYWRTLPRGSNEYLACDIIEELQRENFALAAGLCLHDIQGDEGGTPYCPRIVQLERELAEAKARIAALESMNSNLADTNINLTEELAEAREVANRETMAAATFKARYEAANAEVLRLAELLRKADPSWGSQMHTNIMQVLPLPPQPETVTTTSQSPSSAIQDREPVAWLIEYEDRQGEQCRIVELHNCVGDYRDHFDSEAKSTPLYRNGPAECPRTAQKDEENTQQSGSYATSQAKAGSIPGEQAHEHADLRSFAPRHEHAAGRADVQRGRDAACMGEGDACGERPCKQPVRGDPCSRVDGSEDAGQGPQAAQRVGGAPPSHPEEVE